MRDQKNSVKKTIMSKRAEYGLTRDVPCSEQENKTYSEMLKNGETLPEGVFPYSYTGGTKSDSAFYVLGDEPTDAGEHLLLFAAVEHVGVPRQRLCIV